MHAVHIEGGRTVKMELWERAKGDHVVNEGF